MKILKTITLIALLIAVPYAAYLGLMVYKKVQIDEIRFIPQEQLKDTASANVSVLEDFIRIPYQGSDRTVRIYLPPNYQASPQQRFPVIYFYDGQFLFNEKTVGEHEWQVDETLDRLSVIGDSGAIVVGIDHVAEDRPNEYNPFPANHNIDAGEGHGDKFAEFVVNDLKSKIDAMYRTRPGPDSTVIGGASFGANMAYYTINTYPDVFHGALIFSPAFWASSEYWNLSVGDRNRDNYRIFINVGEYEGWGMKRNARKLYKSLIKAGMSEQNVRLDIVDDLDHTQLTWRDGFQQAYPWILNRP